MWQTVIRQLQYFASVQIKTNNLLNFIHTETLQGREFTRLSSFLSSLVGGQKEAG